MTLNEFQSFFVFFYYLWLFLFSSLTSWLECKVRDSCGISGTGETPNGAKRRGGSPHAPRKASTWSGNQPLPRATKIAKLKVTIF
jgi:hypothetical protein